MVEARIWGVSGTLKVGIQSASPSKHTLTMSHDLLLEGSSRLLLFLLLFLFLWRSVSLRDSFFVFLSLCSLSLSPSPSLSKTLSLSLASSLTPSAKVLVPTHSRYDCETARHPATELELQELGHCLPNSQCFRLVAATPGLEELHKNIPRLGTTGTYLPKHRIIDSKLERRGCKSQDSQQTTTTLRNLRLLD